MGADGLVLGGEVGSDTLPGGHGGENGGLFFVLVLGVLNVGEKF